MIEVLLVIFIIVCGTLGYLFYRSLGRLSFYEDMYSDMYQRFFVLGEEIRALLEREIYSNDPVIKGFVDQFRENSNVGLILKTGFAKSSVIDRYKTKEKAPPCV